MPVTPIKRVLDEEVGEGSVRIVIDRLERQGVNRVVAERQIRRIRSLRDNGMPVKSVSFPIADAILCALWRWDEWYLDPDLRAVYETIGTNGAAGDDLD